MLPQVSVSVPARPASVRVVRAVVASVASRLDFTYDGIEDLRIAVDEASAQVLTVDPDAGMLTVRIGSVEDSVELEVSTDGKPSAGWPPPDVDRTMAWRVLSAVTDDAAFEVVDDRPTVRIRKRSRGGSR